MNNILLISEDFIKTHSALSDNYFGKYLTPSIVEAQDMGLQMVIGSCLYNKLLSLVGDESIKLPEYAAYKGLLDDYIQPYLLYRVLSQTIIYANVKLANIGTVITNDEHIVNLSQKDIDLITQDMRNKCAFYQRRLGNYLLDNKELFSELNECTCREIKANLTSAEKTGIWLGGPIGKL